MAVILLGIMVYAVFAGGCAEPIYAVTVSEPPATQPGQTAGPQSEEPSQGLENPDMSEEASQEPAPVQTLSPQATPSAAPAGSELSQEQLKTMEEPLAGLLAASMASGTDYSASQEFYTMYAHMMVDMFYSSEAKPYDVESNEFSEFVKMSADELDSLLKSAFGPKVQAGDLKQSPSLIEENGAYYFGVGDAGISVNVKYKETQDEVYQYAYSAQIPGLDAVNGEMDVKINSSCEITGYTLSDELPKIGG